MEVKPQDTLQISMNNRSMSMRKLGMVNDSFLNFEVANLSQISEAEPNEAVETLSSEEEETSTPKFDLFVQLSENNKAPVFEPVMHVEYPKAFQLFHFK